MLNLLWKEWHEQSWKLGFGCIVLGALALIGLRSRIIADEAVDMWVCCIGLVMLPILSSTGLLPAERAEGTFESLIALPVSPRHILLAKTLMGILLCAGPILLAALVTHFTVADRELSETTMFSLYFRSTLAAISLFIWMQALTARLPNETRAGLLAVGILILWLMITGSLDLAHNPLAVCAMTLSPLGFVFGYSTGFAGMPPLIVFLGVQVLALTLLWFLTSKRFVNATE